MDSCWCLTARWTHRSSQAPRTGGYSHAECKIFLSAWQCDGMLGQFGDALIRLPVGQYNTRSLQAVQQKNSPVSTATISAPRRRQNASRTQPAVVAKSPHSLGDGKPPSYKLHPQFGSVREGLRESQSLSRLLHTRPQSAPSLSFWAYGQEDAPEPTLEAAPVTAAAAAAAMAAAASPTDTAQQLPAVAEDVETREEGDSEDDDEDDGVGASSPSAADVAYGWRTSIMTDRDGTQVVPWGSGTQVMLSTDAAATAAHTQSSPVIGLHGRAHFFLKTGVLPESLLPKPGAPPQAKAVNLSSSALAKKKERQRLAAEKADKDRLLVEAIMERMRRESPPPARRMDEPAATRARRPMPGAELAQKATDRANRVVRDPPVRASAVDELVSTVHYVQQRNYGYQSVLNTHHQRVTSTAGANEEPPEPQSRKGKLNATRRRAAGTSSPMLPPQRDGRTAYGLYLYPANNAHLLGADFIATRAHPLAGKKSATFSQEAVQS